MKTGKRSLENGEKHMANNKGSGLSAGVGIAALAAAAAGAYYFYGKNGSKHRKNLKSWAVKARGEVMERVEKLRDVSQATYSKAVEQVMDKYKRVKNIDPQELADLGAELKGHWDRIYTQISGPASKGRKKTTKK